MHLELSPAEISKLRQRSETESTRGTVSLSGLTTAVIDAYAERAGISRMQAVAQAAELWAHKTLDQHLTRTQLQVVGDQLLKVVERYGYDVFSSHYLLGSDLPPHAYLDPGTVLGALIGPSPDSRLPGTVLQWLTATYHIRRDWLLGKSDAPAPAWPSATAQPNLYGTLDRIDQLRVPTAMTRYQGIVTLGPKGVSRADLLERGGHRVLVALQVKTTYPGQIVGTNHYLPIGTYDLHIRSERLELMALFLRVTENPHDMMHNAVSRSCTPGEYADLLSGRQHLDELIPVILQTGNRPEWHASELIVLIGPGEALVAENEKIEAAALIGQFREAMFELNSAGVTNKKNE